MNQTMAYFFRHGDSASGFEVVLFAVMVVGVFLRLLVVRYWRFFVQWLNGKHGHGWQTVSAVMDVVSVVKQTQQQSRGGEEIVGYLATLTYFYHNPGLQTGDYSRMFDTEEEAQEWSASYKGKSVMVHVDPHDPSVSVLRKEEL